METISRARIRVRSWAGDSSDLERITKNLVSLGNDAQKQVLDKAKRTETSRKAKFKKAHLGQSPRSIAAAWKQHEADRIAETVERFSVRAEARFRRWEREEHGTPVEVLRTIGNSRPKLLMFEVGDSAKYKSTGYRAATFFGRASGCGAYIEAPDHRWVLTGADALGAELHSGDTWYSVLRSWVYGVPLFAVLALITLALFVDDRAVGSVTEVALLITGAVAIGVGCVTGVRGIVPVFELHGYMERPRGRILLGAALTVAAWLISVIIGIVT